MKYVSVYDPEADRYVIFDEIRDKKYNDAMPHQPHYHAMVGTLFVEHADYVTWISPLNLMNRLDRFSNNKYHRVKRLIKYPSVHEFLGRIVVLEAQYYDFSSDPEVNHGEPRTVRAFMSDMKKELNIEN